MEYRIRKISVNEDHERPTHSVATRVLEGEETPHSHARLLLIAKAQGVPRGDHGAPVELLDCAQREPSSERGASCH